jgi:hypothetical protein
MVLVDPAWMEAVNISLREMAQIIQELRSGQNPQSPNGSPPGRLGMIMDIAKGIAEIFNKIGPVGGSDDGIIKRIGEEVVIRAAQQQGINVPPAKLPLPGLPPTGN